MGFGNEWNIRCKGKGGVQRKYWCHLGKRKKVCGEE